jgi:TetR/AcrR family acrAB operon transcriptional repressor
MSSRPRTEPSKHQLLEAAIECFATHGYQGASIDRIARAAGVTKGAVYYHFKDKEELLFETVRNRIVEFESQVLAETSPGDDTMAVLRRVVDACFLTATESNVRRFIMTLMIEALGTNPALSEVFRLELRRMRSFLADVVRRGQETGGVRTDVLPDEAAALIVSAIMGAEIQHYQDPERIDLRAVLDMQLRQVGEWLRPVREQRVERGERIW